MKEWTDDGHCFACGPRNPIGLHLVFEETDEGLRTTFLPDKRHQGYEGILHGGLVATLLDEVAVQMLWAKGVPAVTARFEVRFLRPARVGKEVVAEARLIDQSGKVFRAEASLRTADGELLAKGCGTYLRVAGRARSSGA